MADSNQRSPEGFSNIALLEVTYLPALGVQTISDLSASSLAPARRVGRLGNSKNFFFNFCLIGFSRLAFRVTIKTIS